MSKLVSEFEAPDASSGFLLWQVANRWQAAQRKALEPFGLTHVQFVLLASLAWLQTADPVTQKQLAIHASVDIMMTSQVLRALEDKGLVQRVVSPTDKRAIHVTILEKGERLADKAIVAVEKVDQEFFTRLEGEAMKFTNLLRRLL